MISWNKQLTEKEARKLYSSTDGMNFPDTKHNREMIKMLVDEQLKNLRANK